MALVLVGGACGSPSPSPDAHPESGTADGATAGTSGGGGSGGGAGTSDAGGDMAGPENDGCLPACIVSLKASCAATAAKSCVTQIPMTGLIDSCFDNGVKLQQTKPSATSTTIEVNKPDGSLCYRLTLMNGTMIYLDAAGNVAAQVNYRASGDNLATCHDGTSSSFRSDSPACMAAAAKEPQCTTGSCSF